jgi:hypothetical protein
MPIISGKCKKCGCTVQLDIDDLDMEQIKEKVANIHQCPGHHYELDGMLNYWDVEHWDIIEGSAPTEEEFVSALKEQYEEVLSTDEFAARNILKGFSYGYPITNDNRDWDYVHSPKGQRYYITKDKCRREYGKTNINH